MHALILDAGEKKGIEEKILEIIASAFRNGWWNRNRIPGCAEYGDLGLCCGTPSECEDKKRSTRSVGFRTLKGYYNTAQGRP